MVKPAKRPLSVIPTSVPLRKKPSWEFAVKNATVLMIAPMKTPASPAPKEKCSAMPHPVRRIKALWETLVPREIKPVKVNCA